MIMSESENVFSTLSARNTIVSFKGAGGVSICPIMEMGFIVLFERGQLDLPIAFYLIKKY